jgi:hypothetical protein
MKSLNKSDKLYMTGLCCSLVILITGVVLSHKFALWGNVFFTIGWLSEFLLVFSSLYSHLAKLEKQKSTKRVY